MTLPLAATEATVPGVGPAAQVRSLYPVRVCLRDGLQSVGRDAHDGQRRILLQDIAERLTHRRMIVDNQNPERVS